MPRSRARRSVGNRIEQPRFLAPPILHMLFLLPAGHTLRRSPSTTTSDATPPARAAHPRRPLPWAGTRVCLLRGLDGPRVGPCGKGAKVAAVAVEWTHRFFRHSIIELHPEDMDSQTVDPVRQAVLSGDPAQLVTRFIRALCLPISLVNTHTHMHIGRAAPCFRPCSSIYRNHVFRWRPLHGRGGPA